MKTKSVSSKPIWPPTPAPTVPTAEGADHEPSARRATTMPEPKRPEPTKPALRTVRMARPFALARTEGGMILSGPKAWRGSMNEVRILLVFLHSPGGGSSAKSCHGWARGRLTAHGRGQRVVDAEAHGWMRRAGAVWSARGGRESWGRLWMSFDERRCLRAFCSAEHKQRADDINQKCGAVPRAPPPTSPPTPGVPVIRLPRPRHPTSLYPHVAPRLHLCLSLFGPRFSCTHDRSLFVKRAAVLAQT
jgi:hypothetical protein